MPSNIKSEPAFVGPVPLMLPSQMNQNLRRSLLFLSELSSLLRNNSLDLSLTGSLSLCTLGVHLLLDDTLTSLLSLGLVDLQKLVLWT